MQCQTLNYSEEINCTCILINRPVDVHVTESVYIVMKYNMTDLV